MNKYLHPIVITLFIILMVGGCSKKSSDSVEEPYDHSYVGDINLNEKPYETADAVVFTNYYIYGLSAFSKNVDSQITASDVNGDKIPLTISDLTYLILKIIGDAVSWEELDRNQQMYLYTGDTISISDSCYALYMEFAGEANITLHPDFQSSSKFNGVNTYILLTEGIRSGDILSTDADLIKVEASGFQGNAIKIIIK